MRTAIEWYWRRCVRSRWSSRNSTPLAGAGPSSVASDDSSDDDGWRREPGADEVRENYMDSKFGGEGADMSDIVMG